MGNQKKDVCEEELNVKDKKEEDIKSDVKDEINEMKQNLEDKLENKEREVQELNDRFLRLQADFSNFKNRTQRQKDSIYAYAAEELITQLLPIIDNFERALSSAEGKKDGFYEGMEMIYDELIKVLKNNGLENIKDLGEKFDPEFHNAVFQEESDEHEEGTIIEVFQKGYKLKDKVIRPSMVKVAK